MSKNEGQIEKGADNSINLPPPPIQKEKVLYNIGYNCSECSSPIEILSINEEENELSFRCIKNNSHCKKIKVGEYLATMKKYIDKSNINEICKNHNNKENISYCFDCKCHLCKECLKSKSHKNHNKLYLIESQPDEEDINIIKNKIVDHNNKMKNLEEAKIKGLKNELNKNKIKENMRFKKLIKINEIRRQKELIQNNNNYINDIKEIKRKFEKEIKLRKMKYEKEKNNINNKFEFIKNKEILINKNKIQVLNDNYDNMSKKLLDDKQINNMANLKSLNEIIYNTYNMCNNNYYYIININKIINMERNKNEMNFNSIKIEYKDIPNEEKKIDNNILKQDSNFITAEINIEEKDINKKIRIINSFEEMLRNYRTNIKNKDFYKYENEKEIKDNCKIRINKNDINFNYFYEFKEKGIYFIEYIFTNTLTKTDFLFFECKSIITMNFSNFNTQDVTNMRNMFFGCESLKDINLSNLNTEKVTNLSGLFGCCKSLKEIDLSRFNTEKVYDISIMFSGC